MCYSGATRMTTSYLPPWKVVTPRAPNKRESGTKAGRRWLGSESEHSHNCLVVVMHDCVISFCIVMFDDYRDALWRLFMKVEHKNVVLSIFCSPNGQLLKCSHLSVWTIWIYVLVQVACRTTLFLHLASDKRKAQFTHKHWQSTVHLSKNYDEQVKLLEYLPKS